MTKEQCNKCVYPSTCDGVLHFKSSHLNMTCGQSRAKVVKKPKPKAPKAPKAVVAIDPAVPGKEAANVAIPKDK
jgi:hypothetical protein